MKKCGISFTCARSPVCLCRYSTPEVRILGLWKKGIPVRRAFSLITHTFLRARQNFYPFVRVGGPVTIIQIYVRIETVNNRCVVGTTKYKGILF